MKKDKVMQIHQISIAAIAPIVWGSTYFVTTEFLPQDYPFTLAMLRALPAGLLLMLIVKKVPHRKDLFKIIILGALNFTIFWSLLFISAYRLPGGIAATLGAMQALIAIFFAYFWINSPLKLASLLSTICGIVGVGLIMFNQHISFDILGIGAGLGCAASMAAGTVLSKKWRPNVSNLTFTAWQLIAGGLLLLPIAFWQEPPLPSLTFENVLGLTYLGLIGAALTYFLWFRALEHIEPAALSTLGFLSPLTALVLGWILLDQTFASHQVAGIVIILGSVWISQTATTQHKMLQKGQNNPLR